MQPVTGWTYGNGRAMTRGLNQNYQPQAIQDAGAGGLSLGFGFDAVGNLTLLQDSAQLRRLKELGVKLSIDDFGTGYSSLSYLQRFQVDKLKIDQSFVRGLTGNAQNQAIVTAIVQMARSLGLHTTAEGIEDEPTRALLTELGCDQGQGFLFAKPLAAAEFGAFARRQRVPV